MASLIIADDHPLFRAALQDVIRQAMPGADVVEAASFAQLQQCLVEHPQPALVLLDLHMPGAHGFSALLFLTAHYAQTPVLMVSANEQDNIIRRAADHGAAGFISKSASMEAIGAAVQRVARGDLSFPSGVDLSRPAIGAEESGVAAALGELTPQQFRVATMISQGLLNKQIAYELTVTEATVKAHVTEVFRKLGVHSRTQAALKLGSLDLPDPGNG
ncbi:MAG: DNA-binding response regulator [Halomonadaceae bacterium]|nr:MAG: DNA-binding response regulator [Halomonadaceae bacterium]